MPYVQDVARFHKKQLVRKSLRASSVHQILPSRLWRAVIVAQTQGAQICGKRWIIRVAVELGERRTE